MMARPITLEEFEDLYRATAPDLFAYLRRRTWTDPEDLVAEVFTTAWRRQRDLPARELRRAWLFGAARRILLAEARRKGHERAIIEHLAARPEEAGTPSENPSFEHGVAAALGRLSPDDQELILLVEWENLSPTEAATVLGIRAGTARVRLHRARQALAADPQLAALVSGERALPADASSTQPR